MYALMFVSRKRFAKASRTMGKGGGCLLMYGWLLRSQKPRPMAVIKWLDSINNSR